MNENTINNDVTMDGRASVLAHGRYGPDEVRFAKRSR